MPLPAGYEIEQSNGGLPSGYQLESKGNGLPSGYELENSPVQKMDKTAEKLALAKLPQFQPENPIISQRLGEMGDAGQRQWDFIRYNLGLPLQAIQQGLNVIGNAPTDIANKLKGVTPRMYGYTMPRFQPGYTPIHVLPEIQEPLPGEKVPGHFEDNVELAQGYVVPSTGSASDARWVPEHEEEISPIGGAYNALAKFANQFVAPDQALSLPFLGTKTGLAAITMPAVANAPTRMNESLQQVTDPTLTAGQRTEAGVAGTIDATLAGTLLRLHGPQETSPQQLGAQAFQSSQPRPSDFSDLAGQVPSDRQIPLNVPPTTQRFSVDPLGQAADLSQLSPNEQTELLRGPKEYVPREQTIRPAQTEAPVIGQAVEPKILGLPEGFVLEDQSPAIEQANQAAGEPKQGGQISFESEAKADNVPTTNPTAVEPVAEGSKLEQPDPNWEVRVQSPVKMGDKTVPGYVQIDDMSGGQNKWSKGPTSLKAEGFDIPEGLENLPQGKYTMAEAIEKLKGQENAVPELRTDSVPKAQTPEDLSEVGEKVRQGTEAEGVTQNELKSAKDVTARPGTSLYSGVPLNELPEAFKRIKRFLLGMHDSGLKTIYSEHGLSDQTDTPYVVFKDPSKEQIERIQAAADHVGASVEVRNNRTGVYFKGGIQKDVLQDWADFTHKVSSQGQKGRLYSGVPLDIVGEKLKKVVDSLKGREKELRGDYALAGPRIAVTPEQIGFKDVTKEVDAQQLYNRLRNKLSPDEWSFYKDVLPTEGKISPENAAKLMQENGPRIGVKKMTESSGIGAEHNRIIHELDTINPNWRDERVKVRNMSDRARELIDKEFDLAKEIRESGSSGQDRANWSSVAPKTEKDMPGYTEIAVTKPLTGKIVLDENKQDARIQHPSTHSYPPNTLAQVRGYMDKVGDKKVFHIIEVQSDWAQQLRHEKDALSRLDPDLAEMQKGETERRNDTLLPYHERLAIKAAIEHAKKEGADAIVIQDAESAMMTEGHDRAAMEEIRRDNRQIGTPDYLEKRFGGGMRLHYDQILPKIAKELTGHEGEPVSLGKHKMALEEPHAQEGGSAYNKVRQDLVFQNKDGTPKTDVSGRMYPIDKAGGPGPEGAPHSVFEKDKPSTRPTYLYSGVPLMHLEGVKDALKKIANVTNPHQALQGAKEIVPKILDSIYGQGVERGFDESLKHLKAKAAGDSAPHHIAVSAELGNKMIEYASANATVDAYIKAGAPKAADYKANALKSWLNQGIKDGVYTYDKPKTNLTMGGRPMEPVSVRVKGAKGGKDRTLYVRADLANEVKQVLDGRGAIPKAGAQIVLDALTKIQLFGPMDFVAHVGNLYSTVVHSQGKYGNYAADLAARMPVAKQLDAIQKIGWQLYKVLRDNPSTLKRLAELSEIGTGRNDVSTDSFQGKVIRNFDKAGRLVRDQMYDNLVKMGLTKNTIAGRREFLNKMGQYNPKLMSYFMATAKNYVSPFVVAGRRFNKNAIQAVTLQNEVKAASPTAYAQMKISNVLSLVATSVALPVVLNSVINGKPFGRAGTPVGKIDTGKDDKDGRPITIDPMKLDLTRRGLQITGAQGAIEGIRKGDSPKDIAGKMIWDIMQGQLHPWEGPAIRGGLAAEKEYAVSRDPKAALGKGLVQANPLLGSFEKDEKGKPKGFSDYGSRLAATVGVGPGNFLTHQEKLEKQSGKLLDSMSLEDRIKAEKQLKDSQPTLSAEVRSKAAQKEIQNEYKDSQELTDNLSKGTKGWMESRGLSLPGYKETVHIGGVDMALTEKEQARYKDLVQTEYTKAIDNLKTDKLMGNVGFNNLPKETQQIAFNKWMIAAKKIAKGKLINEITANHSESPK